MQVDQRVDIVPGWSRLMSLPLPGGRGQQEATWGDVESQASPGSLAAGWGWPTGPWGAPGDQQGFLGK